MYWPSFNGALADEDARERVVIHTVLSLTHSCLFSFIISRLVSSDEKFDMIHIQNASLAGGVAIGAVANLNINPFSSMIIGGVAGTISVLGYKYLQPFLEKRFGLHDTCGVHNLHGMPGIIGAIASAIAAGVSSTEDYGQRLYELFPEIEHGRSPIDQGGYQMLCLAITLAIALFSGTISGVLVRYLTVGPKGYFQDQHYWEGAEGYIPIKKVIDNTEEKYKFEEKVLKEDAVTRHHKPTMMFQPEQFLSLQKMESKKTNNKYRKKEEENRKNIATLEKYITNIAESDEKVSIRKDEIVETNSPTKEQKAFSPSKYNRINEKE